jgi:hypothetical protein
MLFLSVLPENNKDEDEKEEEDEKIRPACRYP